MLYRFIITFLIFLTGCISQAPDRLIEDFASDYVRVVFEDVVVLAEIADSDEERKRGLMFREDLDEFQGMWFIFPEPAIRTFWMKNTLIPLDIIYVSDKAEVIDIFSSVPSCEKDPCPLFRSSAPARYVLEVKAGFAKKYGLQPGEKLLIESP